MNRLPKLLVAAVAVGATATPALAQYPYPQQPYPPQYPQGYPAQQGYPGQQGYGQNPIQQIVDQLLGNRYNVTDRTAVQQCATAAVSQASAQYRRSGYGQQGYNPYGQGYNQSAQGYNQYGQPVNQQYAQPYAYGARVTSITEVQRSRSGLRVSGVIDSGRFGPMQANNGYYNQQQGYYNQQQGYSNGMGNAYAARAGDLTFRCNVDHRGAVTNLRVRQNPAFRR